MPALVLLASVYGTTNKSIYFLCETCYQRDTFYFLKAFLARLAKQKTKIDWLSFTLNMKFLILKNHPALERNFFCASDLGD